MDSQLQGGAGDLGDEELPDLDVGPSVRVDQDRSKLSGVKPGSYVVAVYEEQWFLAEVSKNQTSVKSGYLRLEYLTIKVTNSFCHPTKADLLITPEEDIILKTVSPEPVNSRGCLGLNKKDLSKVLSLMVVVYLSSNLLKNYFLNHFSTLFIKTLIL